MEILRENLLNQTRFFFGIALISASLTGCGGGGSSDVPGVAGSSSTPSSPTVPSVSSKSLTGVAATGAAMSNAAVTANCSNGKSVSGTTDANGRFSLNLSATEAAPPCMLRAQGPKGTFYSYAETDGTVNINPLTDLSVTKALKGDPAAFFGSFGGSVREIKTSEIKDAIQFIFAGVSAVSGYKTSDLSNPFTAPFAIGNDQDKSLDALADSLAQSGTSYAELRKTVVDNADDRVSFDAKLLLALVTKKINPVVSSMDCTVTDQTTVIKCLVKGKNLTRPSGPITRIESDLGIYVSRTTQQQPKTDSRLPYNPPYCTSQLGGGGLVTKPGSSGAGVFAEELEFTCSSATGSTKDPLLAELVVRNNGRYNNSTNLGFVLYEPNFTQLIKQTPLPPGPTPKPAPLIADAAQNVLNKLKAVLASVTYSAPLFGSSSPNFAQADYSAYGDAVTALFICKIDRFDPVSIGDFLDYPYCDPNVLTRMNSPVQAAVCAPRIPVLSIFSKLASDPGTCDVR